MPEAFIFHGAYWGSERDATTDLMTGCFTDIVSNLELYDHWRHKEKPLKLCVVSYRNKYLCDYLRVFPP